ncbi:MAG TPA: Na(+)/H(+) antiporter subunit C [Thermomonospora sp.]|nr:Na(+)/H(+) antiporter subunit C [Thermomonospora sp.]
MSVVLLCVTGLLFTIGFHLLLQRSLVRVVVGFALLGHAANLSLLLAGGPAGAPPLLGGKDPEAGEMTDPLPQAMALTAIVITFGVTAFLLALAYRSWLFLGEDEVQDDVEDRRIRTETRRDQGEEYDSGQDPG